MYNLLEWSKGATVSPIIRLQIWRYAKAEIDSISDMTEVSRDMRLTEALIMLVYVYDFILISVFL